MHYESCLFTRLLEFIKLYKQNPFREISYFLLFTKTIHLQFGFNISLTDPAYCYLDERHRHQRSRSCRGFLLHDLQSAGPGVWGRGGDPVLPGNHFRFGHVHPWSHWDFTGKNHWWQLPPRIMFCSKYSCSKVICYKCICTPQFFWHLKGTYFRRPLHQHSGKKVH